MGLRRAAWRAGQTPNTTPTTSEKPVAATTVTGLNTKPQPGQPVVPSFIPPTVAAAVARPKARTGTSALTVALVAAFVIAGAGLGFAGGRLTAPAAAPARGNGQFGGNFPGGSFNPNASGNPGRNGGAGGFAGFGGNTTIDGQITAVADGSITVQTSNGSVTLQVPSTVTYHTQAAATSTDVAVGSKVQVTVTRPNFRPDASGQPGASGQPAIGQGGISLTATDITVLAK